MAGMVAADEHRSTGDCTAPLMVQDAVHLSGALHGLAPQWLPQDMLAQAPAIGVAHMVDSALHTGIEGGKTDRASTVRLPVLLQPALKMLHVASFDLAVVGVDEKAEPGDAMLHRRDLRLGMDGEPERGRRSLSACLQCHSSRLLSLKSAMSST